MFIKKYCRIVDISGFKRVSLIEKKNYDCIFWEKDGCLVYTHRPLQCRSFPFWSSHLDSRADWDSLAGSCPGINRGQLHNSKQIDAWLHEKLQEGYIKVINGEIIL